MEITDSGKGGRIENVGAEHSKMVAEAFAPSETARVTAPTSIDSPGNKELDTKNDNVAVNSLPHIEITDKNAPTSEKSASIEHQPKSEKSASIEHSAKDAPKKPQPKPPKGGGNDHCTMIDFGVPGPGGWIDACGGGP